MPMSIQVMMNRSLLRQAAASRVAIEVAYSGTATQVRRYPLTPIVIVKKGDREIKEG